MYVHFCHDNNNVPDYVVGIIMVFDIQRYNGNVQKRKKAPQ